jgi:transcription initiation factor TFIID subunit TAF12
MFKRTHLSIDAIREGDWLVEKMDMGQVVRQYFTNSTASVSIDRRDDRSSWEEEAMKGHGHNALKLCASRSEFTWNSQDTGNYYSWHEFQGSQTETGPLAPDYWWDLIYKGSTEGLADDVSTRSCCSCQQQQQQQQQRNAPTHLIVMLLSFIIHNILRGFLSSPITPPPPKPK